MHQCHCHEENKYIIILFGAERRTHVFLFRLGERWEVLMCIPEGELGLTVITAVWSLQQGRLFVQKTTSPIIIYHELLIDKTDIVLEDQYS